MSKLKSPKARIYHIEICFKQKEYCFIQKKTLKIHFRLYNQTDIIWKNIFKIKEIYSGVTKIIKNS